MGKLGLASRLRDARKHLNLNQLLIASDLGIQQKSISEIENGKILNIPNTYIYFFYKKGISLDWLYEGKGLMMRDDLMNDTTEPKEILPFSIQSVMDDQADKTTEDEEGVDFDGKLTENQSDKLFERLIDSKDFSIKSLMAYIQSLENNLAFIKELLMGKQKLQ